MPRRAPSPNPYATTALLALVSAGCTPVGVPVPRVTGPAALVFESVPVDTVVARDLVLDNPGAADAHVELATSPPFSLANATATVPALGSLALPVSVRAADYADAEGSLTVRWDGDELAIALSASVDADLDGDGATATGAGGEDCDDSDDSAYPGAEESCDERDNDCDGDIDEEAVDRNEAWPDGDGDGYGTGASTLVCALGPDQAWVDGDCDDTDAGVNPGAAEVYYDGIDADCAGDSDYDADGDGQDAEAHGGLDCDDADAQIYDGAADAPYDGIDSDCGGGSDYDADGDGVEAASFGGTDCDDADADRTPGNAEREDGVDQDCDVLVDEDFVTRGDWALSELHLWPSAAEGGFVELHNTSDSPRDLAGLRLVSAGDTLLPAWPVPAGGRAVLCASADASANGGLDECAAVVALGAETQLWLKTTALDEVDTTSWALTEGASLETSAGPDANDAEAAWCTATASYGDGDLGTPGAVPSCP